MIKKGPVSVEISLKELGDSYKSKPEWKVIEDGVLPARSLVVYILAQLCCKPRCVPKKDDWHWSPFTKLDRKTFILAGFRSQRDEFEGT